MNKQEIIIEIKKLVKENYGLIFDFPIVIGGDNLMEIDSSCNLIFLDFLDGTELEDLSENELDEILICMESQIESNEKTFERCQGYDY